jgi:hypothetical protein
MSDTNLSGVFLLREVRERILKDIWPIEPYIRANEGYGWFVAGFISGVPTIYYGSYQRVDFNSDTQNTSTRGSLPVVRQTICEGNLNYGWSVGGYNNSLLDYQSTIYRITYVSDTDSASLRTNSSIGKSDVQMVGNDYFGWIAGGVINFNNATRISNIERIEYSNDTNSPLNRGNLSELKSGGSAFKTRETGWFVGGRDTSTIKSSTERIIYSTDTGVTSTRGSLSQTRQGISAVENDEYGWTGGGVFPGSPAPTYYSIVDRMIFSSDTELFTVRGPLTRGIASHSSFCNNDYGWFGGGQDINPGSYTTIVRMTFNNDTVTASVRGSLLTRISSAGELEGII